MVKMYKDFIKRFFDAVKIERGWNGKQR